MSLHETGELSGRIEKAMEILKDCSLCPRQCRVDRLGTGKGFCRTGRQARVAGFAPHFGEESVLVGHGGSGTIFFSSCNLLCGFCQNYDISHLYRGADIAPKELAAMMIRLMKAGCQNINFVTPTHVVPQILEALPLAVEQGLNLPLVYNTGGYDSVETLRILDGIFDIYMPDFKFWDERYAELYCSAPDYPETTRKAIMEMHRQVGDLVSGADGAARRGLLIRHLVMPGDIAGTSSVMKFIAQSVSLNAYVNIMNQYHPCFHALEYPILSRRITQDEYSRAIKAAREAGLTRIDRACAP
ncbi:radical SAM protein [archaeon]|nr:radical SAM protein [archaeon]